MKNAKRGTSTENFEIFSSRDASGRSSLSARFKLYGVLLILGLAGTAGCLWAMVYTSRSEQIAEKLGMIRVANSLENILDLLALPVLMFTAILTIYAAQRLYVVYREANDPAYHRKKRESG